MNNKVKMNNIIIPLTYGLIFFALIFGINLANPLNIGWLTHGDLHQNYLGWSFFRNSPWIFPIIGSSPSYGLEVSNSIVYTDSNPLLAVIFKIISPLLPGTFQYNGIWLLVCCMLSSLSSWKIVSLFTNNNLIKSVAVIFILFNPAWINRVGHINLMSHFLILLAIYFCLNNNSRNRATKWGIIIWVSCLVHMYIACMVLIFWGSHLLSRALLKSARMKDIIAWEVLPILGIAITLCYIVGYFTVSNVMKVGDYGAYNNNLLSPFISAGWSHFFNSPFFGETTFEGFNYFGVGLIALIIFNIKNIILYFLKIRFDERKLSIMISIISLVLLSTTTHIGFGRYNYTIPIPGSVENILSIFRAAGRFFWPVTYCIVILSIYLTFKNNTEKRCFLILSFFLLVQIIDTSNGWRPSHFYLHNMDAAQEDSNKLIHPFWQSGLIRYKKIRYYPFVNQGQYWDSIGTIAEKHHMSTDAVYLARIDQKKAVQMNANTLHSLLNGTYNSDTVYVMTTDLSNIIDIRDGDSYLKVDSLFVLAPNLGKCSSCKSIEIKNSPSTSYLLAEGWSNPETLGTWNEGLESVIIIKSNKINNKIKIKYDSFITHLSKEQNIILKINDKVIKKVTTTQAKNNIVEFEYNNSDIKNVAKLTLEFPDALSPHQAGINTDSRVIAFRLKTITIE